MNPDLKCIPQIFNKSEFGAVSLLYLFLIQSCYVFGIIVPLEHPAVSNFVLLLIWDEVTGIGGSPLSSLFHPACTTTTGSKTAQDHNAASTMVDCWYGVLRFCWSVEPAPHYRKSGSALCLKSPVSDPMSITQQAVQSLDGEWGRCSNCL